MLANHYRRALLSHTPTPLELMSNLSDALGGPRIWIKRDDCTGLAMGGNKARQLEYYLGDALEQGADTVLTTGAVQSNHVRMTVAAARKLGLQVEVQLEHRVEGRQQAYEESGNPFLVKLMGAKIHYYPVGEDESGADDAMHARAVELRKQGRTPYVIPLGGMHTPFGSLGYVTCAEELLQQFNELALNVDAIVVATGSATTHAGLLAGLRASHSDIPVYGICVRRGRVAQRTRVIEKARAVSEMINHPGAVLDKDVRVDDQILAPGYGQMNQATVDAIRQTAHHEGILLDPTYSGKSMAGLIAMVQNGAFTATQTIIYLHTGGAPGIFGYPELLDHV